MRINLALANIRSSLTRTAISVAGIGVAVILIFMQLGFRGAVEDTATTIYGKLDFDLVVRSKDYLHFVDSRTVPRSLVSKVRSVSGVESDFPNHRESESTAASANATRAKMRVRRVTVRAVYSDWRSRPIGRTSA